MLTDEEIVDRTADELEDDIFSVILEDNIQTAVDYTLSSIDAREWENKEYGFGKVLYEAKVRKLMEENNCDEEAAKVALALTEGAV